MNTRRSSSNTTSIHQLKATTQAFNLLCDLSFLQTLQHALILSHFSNWDVTFLSFFWYKADENNNKKKKILKSNALNEPKVRLQTAGRLLLTLLTLIDDFGCLWCQIVVSFKEVFRGFNEIMRLYMNMT